MISEYEFVISEKINKNMKGVIRDVYTRVWTDKAKTKLAITQYGLYLSLGEGLKQKYINEENMKTIFNEIESFFYKLNKNLVLSDNEDYFIFQHSLKFFKSNVMISIENNDIKYFFNSLEHFKDSFSQIKLLEQGEQ